MTKRLYTAEKVLEVVLEDVDDDQDYDDPDELVMEGSDDEFSDLKLDEDDTNADVDLSPPRSPSPPVVLEHTSSTITYQQACVRVCVGIHASVYVCVYIPYIVHTYTLECTHTHEHAHAS